MKPVAWLAAGAAVALWTPLILDLRYAWLGLPEQAYGWGVAPLALYLAWERWISWRPTAPPGRRWRAAAWTAAAAGLAVYAAALPVLEANALWPTAQWAVASGAALATLAGLVLAGGPSCAAQLAFPIAFVFTALTWPTRVHLWIIGDLASANARLAAELVSALGYPAVVSGNVIAVANGLVGVDEACSGLRSLQAVWMAAWFFGEYFRLNWPRRLSLVGAALAAALMGNLARTSFLTWKAAARGIAESERWHDSAGAAELVLTLLAVAAIAIWIARHKPRKFRSADAVANHRPACDLGRLAPYLVFVLSCALAAVLGTEAWYRAHEKAAGARIRWEMTAPDASWEPVPLPQGVRDVLRYSEAAGLSSQDPRTGVRVTAFLVSWSGAAANSENPEWHDPTVCLPASGIALQADLGQFIVRIGGVAVPFAGYRFNTGGRTLHVFFCHWDAEIVQARADAATPGLGVRARRLQRVREGRRRNDVAHITFELEGGGDAAAVAWLREWAPRLLHSRLSQD